MSQLHQKLAQQNSLSRLWKMILLLLEIDVHTEEDKALVSPLTVCSILQEQCRDKRNQDNKHKMKKNCIPLTQMCQSLITLEL